MLLVAQRSGWPNLRILQKQLQLFVLLLAILLLRLPCCKANPITKAEWDVEQQGFHIMASGASCELNVLVRKDGTLSITRIAGSYPKISLLEDASLRVEIKEAGREEPWILVLHPDSHRVTGDVPLSPSLTLGDDGMAESSANAADLSLPGVIILPDPSSDPNELAAGGSLVVKSDLVPSDAFVAVPSDPLDEASYSAESIPMSSSSLSETTGEPSHLEPSHSCPTTFPLVILLMPSLLV